MKQTNLQETKNSNTKVELPSNLFSYLIEVA